MNKKTKTKILTLSAVSALSLAAIWVLASNPNDLLNFEWEVKQDAHLELSRLSLTTDPTTPQATSKSDVSWTVNEGKLITHTGTKAPTNRISANGTLSFWGSNNNTSDPESLILGGSGNTIDLKAKNTIILASDRIQALWGSGSVVLGSTNARIKGQWNIIQATRWASIWGNDNITLAAGKVDINANNSMAIGKNIHINNNGSFVFNGTSKLVPTKKNNTAIIAANNGMIINTETKTATNTDLTISGSLQVGIGSQIDSDGAIISDNCVKLKGISNGEIGLECREHTNFWGETSLPKTPKCGRNATKYEIDKSNWRGTNKADFCSEGELDITKENKGFRTLEERTTATGTGMYARREFTYDFTICFWDGNPLCAPKKLSKTWRCKTPEGNAIRCEANLQIKKMECDTKTHHFEDVNQTNWSTDGDQWQCLPNIKYVACENSQGLDTTNGRFSNATVKVQRDKSKRNYTTPEPCVLECDNGYHLADNNTRCESNTREVSCENKNHVINTEWGRIANAKYKETRDSENWRPETKEVCRLNCNEGGALNSARTACELSHKIKMCDQTFSSWMWLNSIISYDNYSRDPILRRIPDAKLCDFSCDSWYNKDATNRRCVMCDASKNRDASSESCVDKTKYTCENIPENSHQVGSPNYQQNVSAKLIDESSNNTEPCTYKCNPGYRKQWDQCQKVCNSDQHLDNGQCVSNVQEVECVDPGVNNATVVKKKVRKTRNHQSGRWNPAPKCDFRCNNGFKKSGNGTTCIVEQAPVCIPPTIWNLSGFQLVTWSDQGLTTNMTWEIVEVATPGAKCQYICKKGYFFDENEHACYVMPFACFEGDDITNAQPAVWMKSDGVVGIDNQRTTLVDSGQSRGKTCVYECKAGFKIIEENWKKSCKKPVKGSCNTSEKNACYYGQTATDTSETTTAYSWKCLWQYGWEDSQCTRKKSTNCLGKLPANASLSRSQKRGDFWDVQITLVATNNDLRQNEKCQAVCNEWFTPNSDHTACILKQKPACGGSVSTCLGGDVKDATYNGSTATWKCVSSQDKSSSVECSKSCLDWQERKGDANLHNMYCANKEENNFRCIWDIPKFSSLISKDDEGLTKNTTISLVERWRNTTSKCEYQCDKWYFKVGNRCEKPCYATMVRDGLSEKHYRNYKPFTYYIPHNFIAWRPYNLYDLAKIQSNFFKIIDLSKFPIEWIGASPYYKVPNRLTPDYEWYEEWTGFEYSDRDYTKNTALFIKDWQCKNDRWWNEKCDYLYVRPYESVIKQDSDLGEVYSTHHYTYVSVAQAESGFYTSPGWYHNDRRFQNLWSSALCYFDQESNSCSTSVGYTWWPHGANSLYSCSDVAPKDEVGNCWGTMTYDGKPCSEMKTKESCNKNEKSTNSYAYCKWYGK